MTANEHLTLEEVELIYERHRTLNMADPAKIRLYKQLLDTMLENGRLRVALVNIKNRALYKMSYQVSDDVCEIADKALINPAKDE